MLQYSNRSIDFFRLNTSAIFVLPIFDILFGELQVAQYETYFTPYALDNFLVNTYLDPIHDEIDLVFLNSRTQTTNKSRGTFMYFIIASSYYNKITLYNEEILVVKLNIPDAYHLDLQCIRENRLDDLSWNYIMPFQERFNKIVLKPETTLGELYMGFNIPLCIIQKCEALYEYFEEILSTKIPHDKWLSNPYDAKKETFNLNNIDKYKIL